jgi:hypothetical protein
MPQFAPVSASDVFTILTSHRSYCVYRSSAQQVVDALGRREESIEIGVISPSDDRSVPVTLALRDVVRIVEHQFVKNDLLRTWWDEPSKVVDIMRYRGAG